MTSFEYQISRIYTGEELLQAWCDYGVQKVGHDQWPAAVESGRYDVVVARLAGVSVGSVTIRWDGPNPVDDPELTRVINAIHPRDEQGPTPTIYSLEVHPDHRRHGAGRKLMEGAHLRIKLRPETPQRAALSVAIDNPALNLYDSLGYQRRKDEGQEVFKINVPVLGPNGSFVAKKVPSYFMTKDLRQN